MSIDNSNLPQVVEVKPIKKKYGPYPRQSRMLQRITQAQANDASKKAGIKLPASDWRNRAMLGKYACQEGSDEIAMSYLMQTAHSMRLLIEQCEKTLAGPHSEAEGDRCHRYIVSASAELTKTSDRMLNIKRLCPTVADVPAPKTVGPPPRSAVTSAQQVNVFLNKKDAP